MVADDPDFGQANGKSLGEFLMAKFRVWIEPTKKGNFRVRTIDSYGRFGSPYCVEKNESATINGKVLTGRTLAKAYVKLVEDRHHKSELGDVDLGGNAGVLVEEFIQDCTANNFEGTTIRSYEDALGRFLKEMGIVLLGDVTNAKLRQWKVQMIASKYSQNSIINRLSAVRKWLNWLKDCGKIKESCFGKKMMPMKKDPEPKFYTTEEFQKLDDALEKIDGATRILCHLAHSAGLRKSEATGVCWEDITWNKEGSELLVRKEIAKGKKRSRTIPMDEGLLAILGSRKVGKLVSLDRPWNIDYRFKKARKLAGINPDLDIHGLRHTFAKNYLQRGQGNLASLQKLMGHASILSTMIYAQFEKSYLREGINRAYERRIQEEGILKRAKEA